MPSYLLKALLVELLSSSSLTEILNSIRQKAAPRRQIQKQSSSLVSPCYQMYLKYVSEQFEV